MNKKLLIIFSGIIFFLNGCSIKSAHSISLKDVTADGSEPRLEREFKYSFNKGTGDYSTTELADEILIALSQSIAQKDNWKAPNYVNNDYYVDDEAKEFAYFDIYFDTEDKLNYKNGISYRLRERFEEVDDIEKYFKNSDKDKNSPFRIEFQAKIGREELGDGFSEVNESRFEFREESEPFSQDNPPPSPPWDLEEFINYFQSGKFKDYYTWPAKSVVDYLIPERTVGTELYFEPELILITERQRQHLNIKSPWGSGPNPEQSYIISIDSSKVYEGDTFMDFIYDGGDMPHEKAKFTEIEVEFERNVSGELDKKIKQAQEQGDQENLNKFLTAREAFLEDQKTIISVIQEYFTKKGVELFPANKSKYQQAYDLLN